ncbi:MULTISPECIES: DUF1189 family protein [Anaerostipes]|uniref:DUF1189 family protein n=1 Tax=Anaerostipes TaxID=207244 RepID=UPI002584F37A|nr:DUF1189 family protein [Anaerostipes sp.]MCI5623144.1 DUF1189 domain-containing protein [Anaerostipes sp.]
MEKTEKISWLEQLKIACLKPKEYSRLLALGKGRVVWFFILISFLITFLGFGMDMFAFSASVGGTKNFILNRLPAFELRDGTLSVEETMDFTIAGIHVAVDTTKDKADQSDLSNDTTMDILFARKEMIVKNDSIQRMVNTISFDDFKNVIATNQTMVKLVPFIHMMAFISFFAAWAANAVSYLFFCAFISWMAYLNQKIREEKISFGKIFQLSIYARVIFELIETVGSTAGVALFSGIMWMLISYLGSYQLLLMGFIKPETREQQ